MSTEVYLLDGDNKVLGRLDRTSMSELGFQEPSDLETWLASCKDQLFGRKVLWLARQDWPADDQRSDIIGLSDNGDLIITELKRGQAGEWAVTQVLAYAAEYSRKTAAELTQLYFEQSQKTGTTSLIDKASSSDDAQSRISAHVGDNEVNQSQILLIVAEGFDDKMLAICDYLTRAISEATFSIELWQYGLFPVAASDGEKRHVFLLEQILPPPSIRAQIEAEREAAKGKKWARDPKRIEFMHQLRSYLSTKQAPLQGNRGQSYSGNIDVDGQQVVFQVPKGNPHPWIDIPDTLELTGDAATYQVTKGTGDAGWWWLEFSDVDAENLKFEQSFGDRLLNIIGKLKPRGTDGSAN